MDELTPLRAIRAYCLDCMCGNAAEVRRCHLVKCPLNRFRMGHNPRRAGIGAKTSKSENPGSMNEIEAK